TQWTPGRITLLLTAPACDLEVIAPRHRRRRIAAVASDQRVVLDGAIPVRVTIRLESPLPDWVTSVSVNLEARTPRDHAMPMYQLAHSTSHEMDLSEFSAGVTTLNLEVDEPLTYELSVMAMWQTGEHSWTGVPLATDP